MESMKMIHELVGANIRALRKSFGWSQAVLAEKAEITVSYMTMIELGQRGASLEVIQAIAHSFELPVAKLFEEKPENNTVFSNNEDYYLTQFTKKLNERIQKVIEESVTELKSHKT